MQTYRSRTYCAGNRAQIQHPFARFFLTPATSLPVEFEETKEKSIDFSPINLGAQPTEQSKYAQTQNKSGYEVKYCQPGQQMQVQN